MDLLATAWQVPHPHAYTELRLCGRPIVPLCSKEWEASAAARQDRSGPWKQCQAQMQRHRGKAKSDRLPEELQGSQEGADVLVP